MKVNLEEFKTETLAHISPLSVPGWREELVSLLEELQEYRDKSKTKVVVLCGSSRYCDIMAVCAWFIERDEHALTMGLHLLPDWYSKEPIPDHLAEHEGVADEMDELHLRKIDRADEVFVVNEADYIGSSTRRELDYAQSKGKLIRYYKEDAIGDKVRELFKRFQ